jgi:phosphate acyltransferase
MRIGVDAMGGDFAPSAVIGGALKAKQQLSADNHIVLFGDKEQIVTALQNEQANVEEFEIVHCTQVIEMGEHPAKSFSKKVDSSIAVGFKWLSDKEKLMVLLALAILVPCLVGTMYTIKSVSGIIRPAIASYIPVSEDKFNLLLDVGTQPRLQTRRTLPVWHSWRKSIPPLYLACDNPRVGLLNIGEEEEKGNLVTKSTYDLMKGSNDFNLCREC